MKRKQAPQNINHGVPTGDSLDERLDRAQKELGPQVTNVHVRVEAPYKDDYLEPVKLDPEGPEESAIADPKITQRHWERADFVEKTIVKTSMWSTKQHLVAADDPSINDTAWIVVADSNDWSQVGKWHGNDYVEDAKLLYRESGTTESNITSREAILQEATGLIVGDRNKSYGSPTENFQNTADLWTIQFGHLLKEGAKFTGAHVAQAMMQLKLARMVAQPKRDNYLDLAGYAACGWECEEANDV